ncbi:MAG: type III-B CRISPR module RAMP protein Cmr6 [Proteobacteria bacterium]|nr:type III-B CRISPR module RAMP protein Cmr6 [Pseudomonadota bacterium]
MSVEALRKSIQEQIQDAGSPSHFGLWLNKYNRVVESSSDKGKEWSNIQRSICDGLPEAVMVLYKEAYEKWEEFLKSDKPWCTNQVLTAENRLFVGLGSASVLEFGVSLHHTFGLPYIPGSSIKGVCAAYAKIILGEVEEKWKANGAYSRVLFGAPATDSEPDTAGAIDFLDAWWVPDGKGPFVPEIINCHHQNYYTKGKQPPADWDAPVPVKILALGGKFLFAVRGLAGWNDLVMKILVQALSDWGIGAKTRTGYGRFLKPKDKNRPIATKEGKFEEFKRRIDSNRGTLAGQVNVFLAEIRKETDDGRKTAMAEILKNAFGNKQFKKACKKKKKWALSISELLNE